VKCLCCSCIGGFSRDYVLSLFILITFLFYFPTWNRPRLLWAADRSDLDRFQIFSSVYRYVRVLLNRTLNFNRNRCNWVRKLVRTKKKTLHFTIVNYFNFRYACFNNSQNENSDKEVLNNYFIRKIANYHCVSITIVISV